MQARTTTLVDLQPMRELDLHSEAANRRELPMRVAEFVAAKGVSFRVGGRQLYFSGTNANYLLDPAKTSYKQIKKFFQVRIPAHLQHQALIYLEYIASRICTAT